MDNTQIETSAIYEKLSLAHKIAVNLIAAREKVVSLERDLDVHDNTVRDLFTVAAEIEYQRDNFDNSLVGLADLLDRRTKANAGRDTLLRMIRDAKGLYEEKRRSFCDVMPQDVWLRVSNQGIKWWGGIDHNVVVTKWETRHLIVDEDSLA